MIRPIRYKPTIFSITQRACNAINKRKDADAPFIAIEIIRNTALANYPQKQSFFTRLTNKLYPQSQLKVIVDSKDKQNIFLTTQRTINKKILKGKEVLIDIKRLLSIKGEALRLITESKLGMLQEIKNKNNICSWYDILRD